MSQLSDFEKLAEAMMPKGIIYSSVVENHSCIACGSVEKDMVRVGALIFCMEHWESHFNSQSFHKDSPQFKIYMEFLKKYKEQC